MFYLSRTNIARSLRAKTDSKVFSVNNNRYNVTRLRGRVFVTMNIGLLMSKFVLTFCKHHDVNVFV